MCLCVGACVGFLCSRNMKTEKTFQRNFKILFQSFVPELHLPMRLPQRVAAKLI